MNLSRFQPPTASDEMAHCVGCERRVHYTALDDDGYCDYCRPDKVEEELWWCNVHQRKATYVKNGKRGCDPHLGGIMIPCECVNLTGIAIIEDEPTASPEPQPGTPNLDHRGDK